MALSYLGKGRISKIKVGCEGFNATHFWSIPGAGHAQNMIFKQPQWLFYVLFSVHNLNSRLICALLILYLFSSIKLILKSVADQLVDFRSNKKPKLAN